MQRTALRTGSAQSAVIKPKDPLEDLSFWSRGYGLVEPALLRGASRLTLQFRVCYDNGDDHQ